ncbi:MAG: 4Fe-4S dicluster domain-containing protein [Acidobacteriota bacterium]|jgi:protein NrfC|nr:4Fe-4S dicluster domain-containing protein [Acidobacteriota bacterium]
MSEDKEAGADKKLSRRNFLSTGGAAVAATAAAAVAVVPSSAAQAPKPAAYPASKGYVVYDSKKCIGCTTCMLSCSLTHYGSQSLSLARIQIMQDSFGKFPNDLKMAPCRQCKVPVCVESCPVGAAYIDTENGNVRRIDGKKCIGCKTCIKMCPQQPHRTVWNHIDKKSSKCDLCLDTPYWNEAGGPGGKQACVASCPVKALKFVADTPNQEETDGYDVNLRNDNWLNLGLVESSTIVPPRLKGQAGPQKQEDVL